MAITSKIELQTQWRALLPTLPESDRQKLVQTLDVDSWETLSAEEIRLRLSRAQRQLAEMADPVRDAFSGFCRFSESYLSSRPGSDAVFDVQTLLMAIVNLPIGEGLKKNLGDLVQAADALARMLGIPFATWQRALSILTWPDLSSDELKLKLKPLETLLNQSVKGKLPSTEMKMTFRVLQAKFALVLQLVTKEGWQLLAATESPMPVTVPGTKGDKRQKLESSSVLETEAKEAAKAILEKSLGEVEEGLLVKLQDAKINWQEAAVLKIVLSEQLQRYRSREVRDQFLLRLYQGSATFKAPISLVGESSRRLQILVQLFSGLHGLSDDPVVIDAERAMLISPSWLGGTSDQIFYFERESNPKAAIYTAYLNQGGALARGSDQINFEFQGRTVSIFGHEVTDFCKQVICRFFESSGTLPSAEVVSSMRVVLAGCEVSLLRLFDGAGVSRENYQDAIRWLFGHGKGQIQRLSTVNTADVGERSFLLSAYAEYIRWLCPMGQTLTTDDVDRLLSEMPQGQILYLRDRQSFFDFGTYGYDFLTEAEKSAILTGAYGLQPVERHWGTFDSLMTLVSGSFDEKGRFKWLDFAKLPQSQLATLGHGLIDYARQMSERLPGKVLEMFSAVMARIGFSREGNAFLQDIFDSDLYRTTKNGSVLGLYSIALAYAKTSELKEQAPVSPVYQLIKHRAGISVSQHLPKQSRVYFESSEEMVRNKEERFNPFKNRLDRYLSQKYGPHYALSPAALEMYVEQGMNDVFSELGESYPMRDFLSHPGIFGFSLQTDGLKFSQKMAVSRYHEQSPIIGFMELSDSALIDEAIDRLFTANDVWNQPEIFSELFCGKMAEHIWAIKLPDGRFLHASYFDLWGRANALSYKGKVKNLPNPKTMGDVHVETGYIPEVLNSTAEIAQKTRIELLTQWVQEEGMTLPLLESKLRQIKSSGRMNIAVILNQVFPQIYVGVVETDTKTDKCLYRVGDLFEKLGIPGYRGSWLSPDMDLFRQVGLMEEVRPSAVVSRYTNPLSLESFSDEEFIGLFSRALFSRAGLTPLTDQLIQSYLNRYAFGSVTAQQEPLVAAHHATQEHDPDELAKSMTLAPVTLRKILAGEYDLLSEDVRERWLKIFFSRVLHIEKSDLSDERLAVAKKRVSDAELSGFIMDTIVQDQEMDLADVNGMGRFIQKYDLSVPLQVLGEQPRALLMIFRLFFPDVLKRYQAPELLQALMEVVSDDESAVSEQPGISLLFSWINQKLQATALDDKLGADVLLSEMFFNLLGNWIERDSQEVIHFLEVFAAQATTAASLATLCRRMSKKINAYTAGFVMPPTMKFNDDPDHYIGPKRYQQEAVHQMLHSERKNWLLADEPGMGKSYQAILLAESMGAKRVLWVTTASNRKSVQEEVLQHTHLSLDDVLVVSGNGKERKAQLSGAMTQKYTVISYQTLRKLRLEDPAGYESLTKDLDLKIIDETQRADNEFSQQGREVQRLKAKNTLLLSATPYQHDIRKLWPILKMLDPTEFNEKTHKAFMQSFLEGTGDDYLKMHKILAQYMIRRRKKDYYREPDPVLPAAEQRDALAKQVTVPYQYKGTYVMSDEQAEAYLAIMAAEGTLTIAKIRQLFRVLYDPSASGVATANDRVIETRRLVKQHLLEGKKIILWAHHHDAIDQLKTMLAELSEELKAEFPDRFADGFGYGQFDGRSESLATVTYGDEDMTRRDYDRIRFQKEKDPQVMIAGLEAGAEGLTFTAADIAIFFERPMMFTRMKQAYDRNHRVDGKFHRHELLYYHMVATFPPHLLDRIQDPHLKRILQQGSVDEILLRRLHERGRLFEMVMDGLIDDDVVTSGLFAQIKKDLTVGFEMAHEEDEKRLQPMEAASRSLSIDKWQVMLSGAGKRASQLSVAFDGQALAEFQAFVVAELPSEYLTAIDDLFVVSDAYTLRYQFETLLHSVSWLQRQGLDGRAMVLSPPWALAADTGKFSSAQKALVIPLSNLLATYRGKQPVLGLCQKLWMFAEALPLPAVNQMVSFLTALDLSKDDGLVESFNLFLQKQGPALSEQSLADWFGKFAVLIECDLGAVLKSALTLDALPWIEDQLNKTAWTYLQRQSGVTDLTSLKSLLADSPYAAMHIQKVLSQGSRGADKFNRYLKTHADDLYRTAIKQTGLGVDGADAWASRLLLKEAAIGNLKTVYQVKAEDRGPDFARRWNHGVGNWMREVLGIMRLQYGERVAFALSQYTRITDETYRKKFAKDYASFIQTVSINGLLPASSWAWRHRFGFSGFSAGQRDQDLLGMRLVAQVMTLAENLLQQPELNEVDTASLLMLRNRFLLNGPSADTFVVASNELLTFQKQLATESLSALRVSGQSFGENLSLEAFRSNDPQKLRALFAAMTSGQTHLLRVDGEGTQPSYAAIHLMANEAKAPMYVLESLPGGQNIASNRSVVEHMAERAKQHGNDLPYLATRQPLIGLAQKSRMTAHALPGARTHDFNWSQNRVVTRPVDHKEQVSLLPYSARSLSRPASRKVSKIARRF